ncbi:hypothetical protein F5883DRAFT_32724 [Diaporthe sp. PMI_573]|nr:hypothetical protein F5883DRAFT_32724 [Diaporthaceae sp. PMI_573]
MGFQDNAVQAGFIFINTVVALFSSASFGFNLYTIVQAFKWLDDFVQLSGHSSNDWNWTLVILVFAFVGILGNGGVITNSYKARYRRHVMIGLFGASVLHLAITAPAWDAVRKYRWAEVLREAGYADDAYHVDVFYKLGKTVIIFLVRHWLHLLSRAPVRCCVGALS